MQDDTIDSRKINLSTTQPLNRTNIKQATEEIHKAVQWLVRVGNAYITSNTNNATNNIHWNDGQEYFYSLSFTDTALRLAFRPKDFTWLILNNTLAPVDSFAGLHRSDEQVWGWLQHNLLAMGIDTQKLQYDLPYELPYDHSITSVYSVNDKESLAIFSKLRTAGIRIIKAALIFSGLLEKAQKIKTWPHHLDVCSYIPLEFETQETPSNSISIGMAIHDRTIHEQYLYISYQSPRPKLKTDNLPQLPFGGYWLTKNGWNAAVLPISRITQDTSVQLDKGVLFTIGTAEVLVELLTDRKTP